MRRLPYASGLRPPRHKNNADLLVMYSSPSIIQTLIIQTLDYPNSSDAEATFYYEYYYNLQDGGSHVALWQL